MAIMTTIYNAIILLTACAVSAMIMYAVLRAFGLEDFVTDQIYSIKETAMEIWHLITRE